MATDIYPAIRKQVEALERAARLARPGDDMGPARAALNRRVEELMEQGMGRVQDTVMWYGRRLELARRLLNEEPDE